MMNKRFKIGLAGVTMGLIANCLFGGSADKGADIPVLVQGGALVVDVRTPGEFSGGHIENAVNIPYDNIIREIDRYVEDKDHSIVLYCRSGARAAVAKKSLIQAGYSSVVNAATLRNMRKLLKP